MNRLSPLQVALCFILMAGSGCSSRQNHNTDDTLTLSHRQEIVDSLRADSILWRKAASLTSSLSLEQRCGMLLMPSVYTRSDESTLSEIVKYATDYHVGGIILLKGDTLSARIIADTLARIRPDDMWIAIDAEWGLGMRLKDAPTYPLNCELAPSATPEQMYRYGNKVAAQAQRLGISMILGPVVDVMADSTPSFMSKRSFGTDPRLVSRLATAYSRGLEDGGVISVAKHFPGHGGITTDTHKAIATIEKSLKEMTESDLVPFQQHIDAGLSAIMIGHIAFPAIDPKRQSAAVSESVITDLLRRDMNFKGLILTDALNMAGADGASAADAIAAGADLVLSPLSTPNAIQDIIGAVNSGRIDPLSIERHVQRIIYYKLKAAATAEY